MNQPERALYLKGQILANLWINCALNGVIAFFFYRTREVIPLTEIAVDVQITVAIIAFFVSWIAISAARKRLFAGEPGHAPAVGLPLPGNAVLRSLMITAALMLFYGGLGVTGLLSVLNAGELSNWDYILFKTIYTGLGAACAAALAIQSVYWEYSQ
jgi:hypothetical protein